MAIDLNVNIGSFEDFLVEDAKSLSDASHAKKTGDTSADKLATPAENNIDKNGIQTDGNQGKANKDQGDKTADKLNEDDMKVGDKKDKLDDKEDGKDKKDGDDGDDDKDADGKDKKTFPFQKGKKDEGDDD